MADQVTWADAREVVRRALTAEWTAHHGTLYVAEDGREDATHYLVVAGARESLVDGDGDYDLMDQPALLVSKATGRLEPAPVISSLDKLDAMTPVVGA